MYRPDCLIVLHLTHVTSVTLAHVYYKIKEKNQLVYIFGMHYQEPVTCCDLKSWQHEHVNVDKMGYWLFKLIELLLDNLEYYCSI